MIKRIEAIEGKMGGGLTQDQETELFDSQHESDTQRWINKE